MGKPATGAPAPPKSSEPSSFSAAFCEPPWSQALSQPIVALDLFLREPTDARQRTPTVRYRNRHHNFVGAGSIADPHFHAIKMAADERSIFVPQWNVEHN